MTAVQKQIADHAIETITVLQAKPGIAMTKTFSPSGVKSYDLAKYFSVKPTNVSGIHGLSKLLTKLQDLPRCCIIRGQFKGAEIAGQMTGMIDGPDHFARKKILFDDKPLSFCLIDVDGYEPVNVNPTKDPVAAIDQYIEKHLPECFQGKTYHWQLSASAGTPGKQHLLKAHLWFWLDTPYTSAQMNAWAKVVGKAIDSAVFRTVQVHYTANPIFKDGMADPVPVRSGLEVGWDGDSVPLVIDDAVLLRATAEDETDEEAELVDPRQKKGLIGAFHRAFSVEEVLDRWLSDHFTFEPGSDRRVTWADGGGTPGGAFVTEDRMHICSVHNTDPLDNRATNLFDMVRFFIYGHLDEGMDKFEMLDMASRPSYQAMCDMVAELPEVQAELEAGKVDEQVEARSLREEMVARVKAAESEAQLREEVCLAVQQVYKDLEKADLSVIANEIKTRFSELGIGRITMDDARALVAPPRRELQRQAGIPRWAHGYVYVTSRSQIYRYDSNEWLSREAFEFKHNADAGVDDEGYQVSAYTLLRDNRDFTKVEEALYMPHLPATFNLDGCLCVNTYRPSSVPDALPKDKWLPKDKEAVRRAQRHLEILCSERTEVAKHLIDWLAFNVQFPGVKINYSWLIVGGEGAGKTWIGQLMSVAMGSPNVRVVSVQEVLNPTFNGWAEGSAFAAIEEIRIHGHKQDAWDNLKPVLTNPRIPIIRKGKDGYNAPNVTNYILFSNYNDAVPLSLGSRRVGVISTPFEGDETKQQLDAMAIKEGFTDSAAYFDTLFTLLDQHPGAIREWLLGWSISPDFTPKGRAPETDERTEMALHGVSDVEELVRLVIQEGCAWVSDKIVNPSRLQLALEMWEDGGMSVPAERVANILRKIGYKKYPTVLKVDGKATRVWIRKVKLTGYGPEDNDLIRTLLKETEAKKSDSAEEDFLK